MTYNGSFFRPAARSLFGRPARRRAIKDAIDTISRQTRCCRMAPDFCGEPFLALVRHAAELCGDWQEAEAKALIHVLDETVSSVASAGPFQGDATFYRDAEQLSRELVAACGGLREDAAFSSRPMPATPR